MHFARNTFASARILLAADDAAASGAKAPKAKTVADDMDSRRILPTIELAEAYIGSLAKNLADFDKQTFATVGVQEDGTLDPAIYNESMSVMVATLRKAKGGIKAVVVTPVPKLDALLATESGRAYVQKIMDKEFNHVAVRPLREAEDVTTVADQMPTTIDAFISSGREGGAGIMEAFNLLFKAINDTLASQIKVWAKARLTKLELKRAFESKGYAEEYYPALENRGEGKDSLFVAALKLAIQAAGKKGLDPTIFQRWLDTRNAKAFNAAEDDEDEIDLDKLGAGLIEEDAEASDESKSDDASKSEDEAKA